MSALRRLWAALVARVLPPGAGALEDVPDVGAVPAMAETRVMRVQYANGEVDEVALPPDGDVPYVPTEGT